MKKFYLTVFVWLLFILTSVQSQESYFKAKRLEWSPPICISDTGFTQFSIPVMSVINTEHIIVPYVESPFRPPDYRNINVYVRELQNEVLSDSINLTNNVYSSNMPIIKTDKNGITHLIWGYVLVTPNTIPHTLSTDVYYSFYNNIVWSAPLSIFHQGTINGSNSWDNGKVRMDSQNRMHLLWRVIDNTGLHFYHKVEENCSWSATQEIPFISADYDFIFDKNDRLHMAYFRPAKGGGYDENSVFYRYSDDYGQSWSDSVLVHKSGSQRAIKTQILLDQRNNIHILWTKHLTGNPIGGEAIYHSYSSDGFIWSSPIDAVPQSVDGFLYFSAAMDKNNNIHLVYDLWAGLFTVPVKLCYTNWNGTSWGIPEDIFYDSEMPFIELDSSGYLHLLFLDVMKGYNYYTRTTTPLITEVDEKKNNIPDKYELNQNFPNPFNPTTVISYQLSVYSYVTLKIYDLLGREVASLVDEYRQPGYYNSQFSIRNSQLPSGIYFYTLRAGNYVETKKMVLMK